MIGLSDKAGPGLRDWAWVAGLDVAGGCGALCALTWLHGTWQGYGIAGSLLPPIFLSLFTLWSAMAMSGDTAPKPRSLGSAWAPPRRALESRRAPRRVVATAGRALPASEKVSS